jgi:hypothetical protein
VDVVFAMSLVEAGRCLRSVREPPGTVTTTFGPFGSVAIWGRKPLRETLPYGDRLALVDLAPRVEVNQLY